MAPRLGVGALATSMVAVCIAAVSSGNALAQADQPIPAAPVRLAPIPANLATNMRELLAPGDRRDGEGIRAGGFTYLPRVSASSLYDNNIFATPSNREGDVYMNMDGQLGIVSNWSRHALEFYFGGGGNRYLDHTSETTGYANAGVAGRLDVRRDLWLTSYGRYQYGFEPRGFGESFQPFERPIKTQTLDGGMLVHKSFNRLWSELSTSARRQEFSSGELTDGTHVEQSFRDGTINDVRSRLGYEFSPRTSAFLESAYEWRNYDDSRFDSTGYKLLTGLRYEFTRLVNAEVAVGYLHHNSDGILDDIDTWAYRAQLRYDITPLVAAEIVGSRDVGSPSMDLGIAASNRVDSEFAVRVDYAIRRQVTLMVGAGLGWVDYVDTTRRDNYVRITTGLEYEFRPSLSLWANYSFLTYDSNLVPTIDYDKSVFSVGVVTRY
jgi:hypothetical protein